jgi:hypothetical protein
LVLSEDTKSAVASRIEDSVATVEEAVDVVEKAANKVETNVVEGIQPDITEVRLYMSELSEAVTIRQKRMTIAFWALAAVNLIVLAVVLLRG